MLLTQKQTFAPPLCTAAFFLPLTGVRAITKYWIRQDLTDMLFLPFLPGNAQFLLMAWFVECGGSNRETD